MQNYIQISNINCIHVPTDEGSLKL